MYDILPAADCFPGATPEAIARVEQSLGIPLPQDYRDFLGFSDGFNGEVNGHYLVLWGTGELADLARGYDLLPVRPGQLLIGSNGGPTAFGITAQGYISLPFVFAGPIADEIRVLAADFDNFLAAIASGEGF